MARAPLGTTWPGAPVPLTLPSHRRLHLCVPMRHAGPHRRARPLRCPDRHCRSPFRESGNTAATNRGRPDLPLPFSPHLALPPRADTRNHLSRPRGGPTARVPVHHSVPKRHAALPTPGTPSRTARTCARSPSCESANRAVTNRRPHPIDGLFSRHLVFHRPSGTRKHHAARLHAERGDLDGNPIVPDRHARLQAVSASPSRARTAPRRSSFEETENTAATNRIIPDVRPSFSRHVVLAATTPPGSRKPPFPHAARRRAFVKTPVPQRDIPSTRRHSERPRPPATLPEIPNDRTESRTERRRIADSAKFPFCSKLMVCRRPPHTPHLASARDRPTPAPIHVSTIPSRCGTSAHERMRLRLRAAATGAATAAVPTETRAVPIIVPTDTSTGIHRSRPSSRPKAISMSVLSAM